jgi:hypothetical protein
MRMPNQRVPDAPARPIVREAEPPFGRAGSCCDPPGRAFLRSCLAPHARTSFDKAGSSTARASVSTPTIPASVAIARQRRRAAGPFLSRRVKRSSCTTYMLSQSAANAVALARHIGAQSRDGTAIRAIGAVSLGQILGHQIAQRRLAALFLDAARQRALPPRRRDRPSIRNDRGSRRARDRRRSLSHRRQGRRSPSREKAVQRYRQSAPDSRPPSPG